MRLRVMMQDIGEDVVIADLWTDEKGVVHSTPPEMLNRFETTVIDFWPEHPDEIIRIVDGDLWLRGMLWMSDTGRLGKGRTWLAVVPEPVVS